MVQFTTKTPLFSAIVDLEVEQRKLKSGLNKAEAEVQKSLSRMTSYRIKYSKGAVNSTKKMMLWESHRNKKALSNSRKELAINTRLISQQKQRSAQLARMTSSVRSLGIHLAIMGAAGLIAMKKMVSMFGEFEKSMRRATAVSDATEDQFLTMSRMAEEQSVRLNVAATSAADAFYFLGSAGLSVKEQMQAFTPTIVLAKAAVIEAGQAAEILVDTIKGFKLPFTETTHVTDVLAKAVISSNMNFLQLGETLSLVAGVARTTNNSIEETVAAIELMANVGIKGTRAGTTLRRSLLNLAAPSSKIRRLFRAYNIEISNSIGKIKPYIQLVGELNVVLKNASEAQKNMAFRTLFGARAIAGQLEVFAAGAAKLHQMVLELELAGGTAEEIAGKQMKSFAEQIGRLSKQASIFGRNLGKSVVPMIELFADKMRDAAKSMSDLTENFPKLTGTLTATFGGLSIMASTLGVITAGFANLSMIVLGFGGTLTGAGILTALGAIAPYAAAIILLTGAIAGLTIVLSSARKEKLKLQKRIESAKKTAKKATEIWAKYREELERTEKGMRLFEAHTKRMKDHKQAVDDLALSQKRLTRSVKADLIERLKASGISMPTKAAFSGAGEISMRLAQVPDFKKAQQLLEADSKIREKLFAQGLRVQNDMQSKHFQEMHDKRIANNIDIIGTIETMSGESLRILSNLLDGIKGMEEKHKRIRLALLEDTVKKHKESLSLLNTNKKQQLEQALLLDAWYAQEKQKILAETAIKSNSLWEGLKGRATLMGQDIKTMGEIGASAADSMSSAMSDAFFEMGTGAKTWKNAMLDALNAVHRSMLRLATDMIAQQMMSSLFGIALPSTLSPQMKTATSAATNPTTGWLATSMHTGGFVGPGMFAHAPRLHGGLNQDEFPAILQRGEKVIPRNEVNRSGGKSIIINQSIHITAMDSRSVFQAIAPLKRELASLIQSATSNNHPIRRDQK